MPEKLLRRLAVSNATPSIFEGAKCWGSYITPAYVLRFWVKFTVHRIPATSDAPHGITYSLTLHDKAGARLLGFDNAHRVGKSRGWIIGTAG